MGNHCSRRRNPMHDNFEVLEDDWELAPIAHNVAAQVPIAHNVAAQVPIAHNDAAQINEAHHNDAANRNAFMHRLRKCGKKIVRVLVLRRVWSSMGSWLNTPASHRSRHRSLIATLWRQLSVTVRNYAPLFNHLERRRGQLCYRH